MKHNAVDIAWWQWHKFTVKEKETEKANNAFLHNIATPFMKHIEVDNDDNDFQSKSESKECFPL